jgi:tRNA (Thr-GGU) A37 N-methylase
VSTNPDYVLRPIGRVESPLIDPAMAPRIRVQNLEALDGTPVLDVKPVLGPEGER